MDAGLVKTVKKLLRLCVSGLHAGMTALVLAALIAPALFVVWFIVINSTWFYQAFPAQCPVAHALPDSNRVLECSVKQGIDFEDHLTAKITREEFEAFLTQTSFGNEALTLEQGFVFERTENEKGSISVYMEYGSRVHASARWENGLLTYHVYST